MLLTLATRYTPSSHGVLSTAVLGGMTLVAALAVLSAAGRRRPRWTYPAAIPTAVLLTALLPSSPLGSLWYRARSLPDGAERAAGVVLIAGVAGLCLGASRTTDPSIRRLGHAMGAVVLGVVVARSIQCGLFLMNPHRDAAERARDLWIVSAGHPLGWLVWWLLKAGFPRPPRAEGRAAQPPTALSSKAVIVPLAVLTIAATAGWMVWDARAFFAPNDPRSPPSDGIDDWLRAATLPLLTGIMWVFFWRCGRTIRIGFNNGSSE